MRFYSINLFDINEKMIFLQINVEKESKTLYILLYE